MAHDIAGLWKAVFGYDPVESKPIGDPVRFELTSARTHFWRIRGCALGVMGGTLTRPARIGGFSFRARLSLQKEYEQAWVFADGRTQLMEDWLRSKGRDNVAPQEPVLLRL